MRNHNKFLFVAHCVAVCSAGRLDFLASVRVAQNEYRWARTGREGAKERKVIEVAQGEASEGHRGMANLF